MHAGAPQASQLSGERLPSAEAAASFGRMKLQIWIYAAAGYNVALALFHLGFWRLFRWKEELPRLHPVNRGVMQVLNIMLTAFLLLMAAVLVLNARELTTTPLGRLLLAGLTALWVLRAILQPIFWRTQPKAANVAFITLFMFGAGLHALALPAE